MSSNSNRHFLIIGSTNKLINKSLKKALKNDKCIQYVHRKT